MQSSSLVIYSLSLKDIYKFQLVNGINCWTVHFQTRALPPRFLKVSASLLHSRDAESCMSKPLARIRNAPPNFSWRHPAPFVSRTRADETEKAGSVRTVPLSSYQTKPRFEPWCAHHVFKRGVSALNQPLRHGLMIV